MRYPYTAMLLAAILVSTASSAHKIAIIGGGMAGVAAAAFLHETEHQVHLFEAQRALGGNAQTVVVRNANNVNVPVDAGPQYFAKGAWDNYIEFLKYFKIHDPNEFIEFDTSVVISKKGIDWPNLATPRCRLSHLTINLCKDNASKLLALKDLMDASRKVYAESEHDIQLDVETWLSHSQFDEAHRNTVFLPFLASILGTTIQQTKSLSVLSLAQLYAFRTPDLCSGSKFIVSKVGMGEMIKRIGNLLKRRKNVKVRTDSPVTRIIKLDDGYIVEVRGQQEFFDAVIAASHPSDTAKIIESYPLSEELLSLPYITARIVIHRDHGREFVNHDYPAHYNIILDEDNEVMTTMNLEEIDRRHYGGLLKSWVNNDAIYKAMKDVLKTIEFHHPLMTPAFLQTVDGIKQNMKSDAYGMGLNFALAGGWTQGHETQNTAILSAFEAVNHLELLSLDDQKKWKKRLKIP